MEIKSNIKRFISKLLKKNTKESIQPIVDENYVVYEMMKIKPLVIKILTERLATRDDDNLLLTILWQEQAKSKINTYIEFSDLLLRKQLTTPETVTRTRRKLQEMYPELRGFSYEKRKNAEKLVSKQLSIDF